MPARKQVIDAVNENETRMKTIEQKLTQINKGNIPELNNKLKKEGLQIIVIQ